MESVHCYLCDHEFVEGEEPWLMFEQRLREDGQVECSLADLLGTILEKDLQEPLSHSTLLCDSCNADVLEYESLEKRFLQIRERILNSYKGNSTVQSMNSLMQTVSVSDGILPQPEEANVELLLTNVEDSENLTNAEYSGIADMDLVEEIKVEDLENEEEEEEDEILNEQISNNVSDNTVVPFNMVDSVNAEITSDNFNFAAFNEHVAQNSLPTSVLNLSDGLVNLEVPEKSIDVHDMPLDDQDIIIYDVNTHQVQHEDIILSQKNTNSNDLKNYDNEDGDLNFIISPGICKRDDSLESTIASDEVMANDNEDQDLTAPQPIVIAPKPVCKQVDDDFHCLLCEISPQFERRTLIEHFQTFHNAKFYMCEQCHEGFAKRQDLKTHNEIGHVTQCEFCDQTFFNNRSYRLHKRMHCNTKSFECSVCQKTYVSKAILEEHMNTHTGVRPFKCTECPKDFASKYTLQTHMKIHKERPRPYQCDECDKCFLNQQNLNQHKKLHVSVKAFQCDVCNKAFTTQHSLQVHKIVHSGKRPFLCRICGKSFARRPEIKDHERTHTGEKPFKCEYCPMAFAQRTNLATHKKSTHFNEKLHKCNICLRSFKRKRLLDYHIQAIHTGERPHKCEICGAGFVYPEHYKKHMLIHSGKKPYACEVCGKQFSSRDNRNAHRFVHSDRKPYECMECGAGFMRKPLLLTHMKQTKHINDTIIINQPQFTKPIPEITSFSINSTSANLNNLQPEESEIDVDNDLQSQDVSEEILTHIIFKTEDLLAENVSVSPITDKEMVSENAITSVTDHLIKSDLDAVKYLEFDDLEHDDHQIIMSWADIRDHDKD